MKPKNKKPVEVAEAEVEQATEPSAFADPDFIRAWYARDATARARMRRDYAGLRRLGFARKKVMMLLDAMARRTASALAGAIATTTAGAVAGSAGAGTGAGTGNISDSDEDDMDLGEDIEIVSVSKQQLHHALKECDRAYYPDTIPEELREEYITIDRAGSKAVIFQHKRIEIGDEIDGISEGTYEISFRGTSVETIGTAGQNAIADLNTHVISLDNGLIGQAEKGVVTVGFAKHLDEIYDEIVSNIYDIENADIIVNGHSLGAVTAQLFSLRLLLNLGKRVSRVYSFGSPRGFDTFSSYVAENLEVIQVMDERDPVTYMYPIFYEGHAGYKITQTEQGEIRAYGADEFIPWHARNLEDSKYVYISKQHDTKDDYFKNNWNEDVDILNKLMKRSTTGFMDFVTQFKDKLLRDGATRFLSLSTQYGFKYHYQPNYYDFIQKMPDNPCTFEPPVSGLKRIQPKTPTFFFAEPPEQLPELLFTDYWQWKQPASQPPIPTPQNMQMSYNIADYVTPEMLAHGFILYDADEKQETEHNFIRW